MTLPRTGQRKVGSAPVASLGLTTAGSAAGFSSTTLVVGEGNRAACGGPPAEAILVAGEATVVAGRADTAAAATGWAAEAGAAAADFEPGTVSFMPRLSLAV